MPVLADTYMYGMPSASECGCADIAGCQPAHCFLVVLVKHAVLKAWPDAFSEQRFCSLA
jgi:hypothetical protein